jgi:hypothetical protein
MAWCLVQGQDSPVLGVDDFRVGAQFLPISIEEDLVVFLRLNVGDASKRDLPVGRLEVDPANSCSHHPNYFASAYVA